MYFFIKRNFRENSVYFSLLILSFMALISFLSFSNFQSNLDISSWIHPSQSNTLTYSTTNWYFMLLLPVLAPLPSAIVMFKDFKTGMDQIYISKFGLRKYYYNRLGSVFITTILVFFIPFFVELLLGYLFFFPKNFNGGYDWQAFHDSVNIINHRSIPLRQLYFSNEFIFSSLSILKTAFFAGLLSVFSASFIVYKFRVGALYLLPSYLVCYLISTFLGFTKLQSLVSLYILDPSNKNTWVGVYGFLTIIVIIHYKKLISGKIVLSYEE